MSDAVRAIILAAGQGTRLRPLTDEIPKCLVHIRGIPLLGYQLETMRRLNVTDITVVAGYKAEKLVPVGFRKVVNHEYQEMNMVGTLFTSGALDFDDSDVIISYGDIIYESNVLEALLESTADYSVVVDYKWLEAWSVRMDDPLTDAESMVIDENLDILELGKKPKSLEEIQAQFVGLLKVKSAEIGNFVAFWRDLPLGGSYDGQPFENMFMTTLLQLLIDSGKKIRAVPIQGGWLEIDEPSDISAFEELERIGYLSFPVP